MTPQVTTPAAGGLEPGVARVAIDDAARLLGISRATVRRRLRSGGLKGVQVTTPHGRKWLVDVVSHLDSPNGVGLGTQGGTNETGERFCSPGAPAPAVTNVTPPEPAREVELLQAHVDDLRRQLEERAREVQQLHTLLAQAHQRLLMGAQSGGQVSDLGESGGENPPPAAPRRWWHRLLWG